MSCARTFESIVIIFNPNSTADARKRLGDFFDLRTWLPVILGAIIVLLIFGAVRGGRSRSRRG